MIELMPATAADHAAVADLLASHNLPLDGFPDDVPLLLIAKEGEQLVGCAGIERYGASGLLRSVAVVAEMHGRGLGHRLTAAIIDMAQANGIDALYLLTETAAHFFPKFGFAPTTRDDVPESVKRSVEFTGACPASALVMVRHQAG